MTEKMLEKIAELQTLSYGVEVPVTFTKFEIVKFSAHVTVKGNDLTECEKLAKTSILHSLTFLGNETGVTKITRFQDDVKEAVAQIKARQHTDV